MQQSQVFWCKAYIAWNISTFIQCGLLDSYTPCCIICFVCTYCKFVYFSEGFIFADANFLENKTLSKCFCYLLKVNHALVAFFNIANMSCKAIRVNNFLGNLSEFTECIYLQVATSLVKPVVNLCALAAPALLTAVVQPSTLMTQQDQQADLAAEVQFWYVYQ